MMDFFSYVFNKLYEISGIGNFSLSSLFLLVVAIIGVIVWEILMVGWKKSSLKRILAFDKTVQTDFVCWFLEIFNLFNFISFLLTLGIFYYLTGLLQKNIHVGSMNWIENHYLQFFILFLIGDFKGYITHFLFHRYTALWRTHEFHHSATTLSIITRYRGHFLETAIKTIFDVILFVLLGAPAVFFIYVKVLLEIHQMAIHSALRSDWGYLGKYLLVSPAAHRVHHSIAAEHYNKNFGSTLIIWDRIFNTYHPGIKVENVGIPNNPYNKKGYIGDVFLGFKRFFLSLFKK
jgi:sterol desaturase/sphingolipid hydroxylase (fatty acid hydroxylase superfamily)